VTTAHWAQIGPSSSLPLTGHHIDDRTRQERAAADERSCGVRHRRRAPAPYVASLRSTLLRRPPSQRPTPCLTASKHGRTQLHSPPPSAGFLGGLLDRPSGSDPGDWTWGGVWQSRYLLDTLTIKPSYEWCVHGSQLFFLCSSRLIRVFLFPMGDKRRDVAYDSTLHLYYYILLEIILDASLSKD
jgi:hypothetical protein